MLVASEGSSARKSSVVGQAYETAPYASSPYGSSPYGPSHNASMTQYERERQKEREVLEVGVEARDVFQVHGREKLLQAKVLAGGMGRGSVSMAANSALARLRSRATQLQ